MMFPDSVEDDWKATSTTAGEKSDVETIPKPKLHPLQPQWDFWVWMKEEGLEWRDSIHQQCPIDTIEDIYALHSRSKPPSQLGDVTYFFVKYGVEPLWEHPSNERGGAIELNAGPERMTKLDRLFEEVIEVVLGNQLPFFHIVNAIEVNSRRVRVWLSSCDMKMANAIGAVLMQKLNLLNITRKPKFESHAEKIRRMTEGPNSL